MSRVLVEKETIYTEEVKMLMDGASYAEVVAYMEETEARHRDDPFRTGKTSGNTNPATNANPAENTDKKPE